MKEGQGVEGEAQEDESGDQGMLMYSSFTKSP